jgi:hypothetical protein
MADDDIPASQFSRKCRPRGGGNFKHGFSDSRLEKIFEKMKSRCYNPNEDSYPRYGGRGITVCRDWMNDSRTFFSWAIQNGYADNLQIDRKRLDEEYSQDNCRWITHTENQNNRSNNRRVEFGGENLTLAEWSRKTGIGRTTIACRLDKGFTPAQALSASNRLRHGSKESPSLPFLEK